MRLARFPLFSLLLLLIAVPSSAQTDCGWNPDYNGDNAIGVDDLLGLLDVLGEMDFTADGFLGDCGWNPDYNGDNGINVTDLLALLGAYGEVDFDDDGIFDSQDDCVGAYDECGVCNGPGPSFPIIDEVVYATDSVYVDTLDTWSTFEYAVDTLFTYVCPFSGCMDEAAWNYNPEAVIADDSCTYGPEQCGGATTLTYDGYTYDLVAIGEQCWFKENLRTAVYSNGDAIPGALSNSEWAGTNSGAQAIYENSAPHLDTYGRLYNWYAVDDARGLCPTGWHVPSDGEWTELTYFLGGGYSGVGSEMKSSSSDTPPWNGSNSSGFSGLPGGYRNGSGGFDFSGSFDFVGSYGYWWSSSPANSHAWSRRLSSFYDYVIRSFNSRRSGLSVRCVRD